MQGNMLSNLCHAYILYNTKADFGIAHTSLRNFVALFVMLHSSQLFRVSLEKKTSSPIDKLID